SGRARRGGRPMSIPTLAGDARPRTGARAVRTRRPALRPALRPTVVLSALVLLLAFAWALAPSLFTGFRPTAPTTEALQSPSAAPWFGTDATGRDVCARVVHGASHSLTAALVAVAVGLVAGTTLGVLAGTIGGLVEEALMRLVDVLLAIPGLLLSLSVVILLGFGTTNAAI